jgi:hypothetical protein
MCAIGTELKLFVTVLPLQTSVQRTCDSSQTDIEIEGLHSAILRNTDNIKYETQRTNIKQMAFGKPEEHTKNTFSQEQFLGTKNTSSHLSLSRSPPDIYIPHSSQ